MTRYEECCLAVLYIDASYLCSSIAARQIYTKPYIVEMMSRKRPIFIPAKMPQCCGKNRYMSRLQAEQIAEEQMLLTHELHLTVYACLCGCGGWHLTRQSTAHSPETSTLDH